MGAGIAAFYVALQLIWPTPFGIVVWGLVISSLTALLAFGLVLIYRSHRVINFAQADLGAVPASLCVSLVVLRGWSYWVAVPLALVFAVALGSAVEFLVIRRFARAPRLILMVATIGLAQLLAGVGEAIPSFFDAVFPPQTLPLPFDFRFVIEPFIFHAGELVAVITTLAVTGLLFAFLRYTNMGIAMRASASSADRAALLGVNVGRVHNLAWVIATLIATIGMILRAGVLGLPLGSAFGPQILLRALAAAVIGRMENFAVILASSCAIGIVEVAIIWNNGSGALIDPVLFVVVLGALLLQRRNRESPTDDQAPSTWAHAATVRPIPRELAKLPEVRWVFRGLRVPLRGRALCALPALLDERYTNLAAAVVIYSIIAISLVMLTGWAGEISLGQVAFVAIGSALRRRRQRALAPRAGAQLPARRGSRGGGVGVHRHPGLAHPRPVLVGDHARLCRSRRRRSCSIATTSRSCPTTSPTASSVARFGRRSARSRSTPSAATTTSRPPA